VTANSESKKIIVDSFAWVEYFQSTPRGEKIKNIVDSHGYQLFTTDACMAEIKFSALQGNENFDAVLTDVLFLSTIISSDLDDWLSAAEIKFEKRKTILDIGIVDCLLIHHAKKIGARILTGDRHFAKEKGVILV
jgi:predicted nucleic acid-binding protein